MTQILTLLDNLILILFTAIYVSKQFKTPAVILCLPFPMPHHLKLIFFLS